MALVVPLCDIRDTATKRKASAEASRHCRLGALSFVERLVVFGPRHLSGFWVDQVHPRACDAGDGFVSFSFFSSWIVGDKALHVQARVRTAIEKWRHWRTMIPFTGNKIRHLWPAWQSRGTAFRPRSRQDLARRLNPNCKGDRFVLATLILSAMLILIKAPTMF